MTQREEANRLRGENEFLRAALRKIAKLATSEPYAMDAASRASWIAMDALAALSRTNGAPNA